MDRAKIMPLRIKHKTSCIKVLTCFFSTGLYHYYDIAHIEQQYVGTNEGGGHNIFPLDNKGHLSSLCPLKSATIGPIYILKGKLENRRKTYQIGKDKLEMMLAVCTLQAFPSTLCDNFFSSNESLFIIRF